MKILILLALLAGIAAHASEPQSPYAGQQFRTIKSMSDTEIEGYLAGNGMGLAKVAELNQYPGPKHVLELSDELNLDDQQLARTTEIFQIMQVRAAELGHLLVQNENELDALFAGNQITETQLKARLAEIGQLQSEIRYTHLLAHLQQVEVLSAEQIRHYQQFRGYSNVHDRRNH